MSMRKLTKDDDIFRIRDTIVKVYLKLILRRFKKLNQSILAFDELNVMGAVNSAYEDVISLTVQALVKVVRQTYRWICDDDFPMDMWMADAPYTTYSWLTSADLPAYHWLMAFLDEFDPVTHYKFFDEADRKRSRTFEAIMSCRTKAEQKKQIEAALKQWAKQFEQTSDNVVEAVLKKAYKDNNIQYVRWYTMKDKRVCSDCHRRDGKIYPITSPDLHPLHYNCRCWWLPVRK